ncbi:MAG: hypothetical protein R3C41_18015 [Calditrichia bacterium]
MPRILNDLKSKAAIEKYYQRKIFKRNGQYYLFWADSGSEKQLNYRFAQTIADLATTTEIEATSAANSSSQYGNAYDVFFDRAGDRVAIAWVNQKKLMFKLGSFNADGSISWGTEQLVEDGGSAKFDAPVLARGGDGIWGIIVRKDGSKRNIHFYSGAVSNPGDTGDWVDQGKVTNDNLSSSAEYHRIAATGSDLLLIWREDEKIQSRRFRNGEMASPQILENPEVEGNQISGAVSDAQGNVQLVFLGESSGHPLIHATYDAANDSWSHTQISATTGDDNVAPSLQIDGAGNLHVVYRIHSSNAKDRIHYFQKPLFDDWRDETANLPGDLARTDEYDHLQDTPIMAAFDANEVLVAWMNERDSDDAIELWMDSIPLAMLQDVTIDGPFWQAKADVLQKTQQISTEMLEQNETLFRSIFVDGNAQSNSGESLSMPGVIIAVCAVKSLQVTPNGAGTAPEFRWQRSPEIQTPVNLTQLEIDEKLRSGELTLVMLQADPAQWSGGDISGESFKMLAGDISLDVLEAVDQARDKLFADLNLATAIPAEEPDRFIGLISAHASGLSLYGSATLPWEPQTQPVTAPFLLTRLLPDPAPDSSPVPGYRLTVEYERLTVAEENQLIAAWRRLSRYVNPRHPLNGSAGSGPVPNWMTLEITNPMAVPRLFWPIVPWPQNAAATEFPVGFERGQFNLLMTDQQAYDSANPPGSLARIIPDNVVIQPDSNGQLRILLDADSQIPATSGQMSYQYLRDSNSATSEAFTFSNLKMAYSPVETPRTLREFSGKSVPEWDEATPLQAPVLWGFMPLEDGWAQLPVLNLTEQIFLDAKVAQSDLLSVAPPRALSQGAVSYGNDAADVLNTQQNEQAWNLTFINAKSISGTLVLSPNGSGFALADMALTADSPEVAINGLFWLSSGKPTERDALPDMDNWVSGLQPVPLQSVQNDDLFPSPIVFELAQMVFAARSDQQLSANLQNWSYRLAAQITVLQKLIDAGVLPESVLGDYLPLIWRRHPNLPMVQALPLTQNQSPPNNPAASRQLVPFELLSAVEDDIPVPSPDWAFGVPDSDAAAKWPALLGNAGAASEWKSLFDLPLTALSLPGLHLDPRENPDETGLADEFLPAQFRFDMPYTDEINALAQLPKSQDEQSADADNPDAPVLQPQTPLTRETFADFWQELTEKASLSRASAVAAFLKNDDVTLIRHLIEPFVWPVSPTLETGAFPGKLSIADSQNGAVSIDFQTEAALEGISGRFVPVDAQTIRRLDDADSTAENPLEITAGSMAAHRNSNGEFVDQRGLARAASVVEMAFIRTRVKLHEAETAFDLTTAKQAIDLQIHDGASWHIWFRDLPIAADSSIFDRSKTVSAFADDINDPEALSRERNFLNGYEWRISDDSNSALIPEYLTIYNLHFYPLTLEKLALNGDEIAEIEMIGRIQLPLPGEKEMVDFSNAAKIIFRRTAPNTPLAFAEIALVSDTGEWPLALSEGENSDAPHLFFGEIRRNADGSAIEIDAVRLHFYAFGEEWRLDWPEAIAFSATPENPQISEFQFTPDDPPAAISPKSLKLAIDVASGSAQHSVSILLAIQLGNRNRLAFDALVRFHLLGYATGAQTGDVVWENGVLFRDLQLNTPAHPDETALVFRENSLQFRWTDYQSTQNTALQILPGMHIQNSGKTAPGMVTLTFTVSRESGGLHTLHLRSSFVEMLLFTGWGQFLQRQNMPPQLTRTPVLGSSAGQITFGYTAQWIDQNWQESFVLNGFLEVCNLISWPQAMALDIIEDDFILNLPPAQTADLPALNHTRHTMRILLNQHNIPLNQLVEGAGELLFNLAENQPWQFLAVVEHQLTNVLPDAAFQEFVVQNDRRWTALQEVRLVLPTMFKQFLQDIGDKSSISPLGGVGRLGEINYGYLGDGLRNALISEIDKLPGQTIGESRTLIVEASAPHWIRQEKVRNAAATTLQFLPNGSQMGILSSPDDFLPSKPATPKWLLFTTPFLGRLQPKTDDLLDQTTPIDDAVSMLQIDPLLRMHLNRQSATAGELSPLALALTSWANAAPQRIRVSGFDLARMRSWARLDSTSLEENWFRLQHPIAEPGATFLQSVTAALPDTPARLSRPAALEKAFDTFRTHYPPQSATNPQPALQQRILWRESSLLQSQGVSSVAPNDSPPYGWHIAGLQLLTSALASPEENTGEIRRFPAATVVSPVNEQDGKTNKFPLSFAVSPYLGLEFRPAPAEATLKLVAAELLCLDRNTSRLTPVASHFWEVDPSIAPPAAAEAAIFSQSADWAAKIHERQSPDSPLAMLRYREIRSKSLNAVEAEAPLVTTYSFAIVPGIRLYDSLNKRVFRIRSAVQQLRFREGNFAGFALPKSLKNFELAPPQVNGVQPLYLPDRPVSPENGAWPWGMSALRMSVKYADAETAVLGTASDAPENPPMTLWWQAPQHFVQFRSAISSEKPTAGLPPNFRAPAIKSFLPVIANPPMPAFRAENLANPDGSANSIDRWQPVLPGALRFLLTGNRTGTMLALRHQLLRQSGLHFDAAAPESGESLVSGSVPVQHRVPRPVPLPANRSVETALQTWASYFEPRKNMLVSESPVDEAFFAECGSFPARRLQMQLAAPRNGAVDKDWNGNLVFRLTGHSESFEISDWQIALSLADGDQSFDFIMPTAPGTFGDLENVFIFALKDAGDGKTLEHLQTLVKRKANGSTITANAKVSYASATDGFSQTLTFPLRTIDRSELPLPLKPNFIHFEDPEYNRRLASPSAHAAVNVKVLLPNDDQELHEVTLAADRRIYNPDSRVALRFDWDDNRSATSRLTVQQVDSSGVAKTISLVLDNGSVVPFVDLQSGKLLQISLQKLQRNNQPFHFVAGDVLQFKLAITDGIEPVNLLLQTDIVSEPVIPVSGSAYALLRRQQFNESEYVDCARFAWGPAASRVEMVCPEDLRSEVVRRRAVFQWTDALRNGRLRGYAIQKISPNGATHFPKI